MLITQKIFIYWTCSYYLCVCVCVCAGVRGCVWDKVHSCWLVVVVVTMVTGNVSNPAVSEES